MSLLTQVLSNCDYVFVQIQVTSNKDICYYFFRYIMCTGEQTMKSDQTQLILRQEFFKLILWHIKVRVYQILHQKWRLLRICRNYLKMYGHKSGLRDSNNPSDPYYGHRGEALYQLISIWLTLLHRFLIFSYMMMMISIVSVEC